MRVMKLPCCAAGALIAGLTGCASSAIVVPVDPAAGRATAPAVPRRAQVVVSDIRRDASLERTAIGGMSLGKITLQQEPRQLVQALVEARADAVLARLAAADAPVVYCGIRVFDVTTPATALYWDVTTQIELVLRVHGQDRIVSGKAAERTFVWPSQAMIARVTDEALRQVGDDAERALAELLAAPR